MLIFDTVVQNGMHIFFERVNCLQNFIYLLSHFSYRTNIRTRYKRYGNFRIQAATRYSRNLQVLRSSTVAKLLYTVLILYLVLIHNHEIEQSQISPARDSKTHEDQ